MKMREMFGLALLLVAALALNVLFTDPHVFGLFVTKLTHAVAGAVLLRAVLSYFDRITALDFKGEISDFTKQAFAVYLGARVIAFAILFGAILG